MYGLVGRLECDPSSSQSRSPPHGPHNQDPGFFQISSAKPSDAGTYVCLAQNALGTAQKRVEVIVDTGAVAPGAPQVQVEEVELTVEAGHTATLRCSATGVDGRGPTRRAEPRAWNLGIFGDPKMMSCPGTGQSPGDG